jgi:hypothetical protein
MGFYYLKGEGFSAKFENYSLIAYTYFTYLRAKDWSRSP